MGIRTIIFDLGNTVVNFDHAIAVKRILPFTDKTFQEMLDLFFDSGVTEKFETGKISAQEFYREVKRLLDLKLGYKDFVTIWNEIFFKNPESEQIVKELKPKYRLLLLSNINVLHMEYLKKQFDIIGAFDEIITSYEVGYRKPDKYIYDAVLDKVLCPKNELVYTDDREDLINASLALGIPSIHFKNASQLKEDFKKIGISFNGP